MQEELLQFELQKVWTLVDLPNGKRAIETKLVFRNKKGERGIVVRNKARQVAQGYTQEEGIDYDEVFAPVSRIEAIRLILVYASYMWFIVYQMDVKSAFLYGTIEEERFPMSSMGELTFFLGLQVQQKEDGIFISQDKYVDDILKKFDYVTVKTASTPMEPNKALVKDEEADNVDVHLYRSMIGSLMYLTTFRPDITFVICACARFQVTPKILHLHVVKRIFRYLKGQPKLGLWYLRDSPFDLEAFSDSDYVGASLDRKSITGGCQFLSKRLISWQCKKQTIVANSTTEAEYIAAVNCCGQVLWIQNQMLDYEFNFMNTKIYIDNESTIYIVKNPKFHAKTKHIEIRHHFIRDSYKKWLTQVIKVHSDKNVADLLTKAFDVSREANYVNMQSRMVRRTCNIKRGRDTKIPQSGGPPVKVGDEAVHKELGDRMERAATTASSLEAEQDSGVADAQLRSMIGSLMYLTASRPDIMFAIYACARFQVTPKVSHLHAMKRIFRYLKALTGNPQQEVLWIQNQMLDYGFNFMTTKIYIDNESTICIVKNLVFHSKTKNIEIRHHFIRDSYEKWLIQVIKIHTDHNVTDLPKKSRIDGRTCNNKQKYVKSQIPKRGRDTKIHQSGGPPEKVSDEAVHKELGDRIERAATTASSLEAEQDSGNINRTQSMATLNELSP
ncbi:putative ribonuclease H-like domain-containing protein [Tanacetum coccineum]